MSNKLICLWMVFFLGSIGAAAAEQYGSNGDPSLLGRWNLDEGDGDKVADLSGHGHDGKVFGVTSWEEGYVGRGALRITGGGIKIADSPLLCPLQHVYSDDELVPSLIKFATDGSPVLIIYQADRTEPLYPDCARPGREGARGILNAFELIQMGPLTAEHKIALSK
ncbi:MAG: hypothetical protein ACYTEL_03870 [Planctomycetota bacterium]|jgi:hypothetical protein